MKVIINMVSAGFDMSIVLIYLSNVLAHRRSNMNKLVFYLGFVLMELITSIPMVIFEGRNTIVRFIATVTLSGLATFLLTLFYIAPVRHRIFVTLSFQIYCNLSGMVCFIGVDLLCGLTGRKVLPDEFVINFLSKIFTLLLAIFTIITRKGMKSNYRTQYNLLILLAPIVSIITIATVSYPSIGNSRLAGMQLISILGLMLLNMANLNNLLLSKELQDREQQLIMQNRIQADKYNMISAAYRDTRRLIHDTRNHYIYIKNAIEEHRYDIITDYINKELNQLENKHISVNSGNLAIDSCVGYYLQLARQEGTKLSTKIRVIPDLIPVRDYDLCTVIGNLLENSLEACRKIGDTPKRNILLEAYTSDTEFVIHITNSVRQGHNDNHGTNERSRLEHGYGIENVQKIVKEYHGVYTYGIEGRNYSAIIVIPVIV